MTNGEIPECFSLKSITVAVTTAMCFYVGAIPAQATNLFNPVPGTVEHNGDLVLTNTGTQFDPTGIGFIGGQTTTPIEFDFNGKVELNLKQESMTADEKWSAYGVWVRNSEQGNAHIKFNKDLIVNVENTTNMGVGLVCDSNYDSVGGPQGQDNGSTITLNGASTINVKGNSIIGAAAGSMFNNNSNGGGHLVFGSVPSSKLHIINVTSDWSSKTNTSKDSDWAIGLLAFDRGVDVQGDMNVNLNVENMKVNDTNSLTGEWEDHAAGIYVAKESTFTTAKNTTLNITVSGNGSGLTR